MIGVRRTISCFLVLVLLISNVFVLFSCGIGEIRVKFVDDTVYARFNSSEGGAYMPYNAVISFEDYEKGSEKCPSRSYCYAKFLLTFNNTPRGYTAYEIYDIDYVTVDGNSQSVRSRAGKKYNQIEIILWLPYFTANSRHSLQTITFTHFDSKIGKKVQKTEKANCNFESTVVSNWVDRFDEETLFKGTLIESTKQTIAFSIDSSIEYDKLIYNVTQYGDLADSGEFKSLVNEEELYRAEKYTYRTPLAASHHWYFGLSIVGYQRAGVNYYFSPITFYIR